MGYVSNTFVPMTQQEVEHITEKKSMQTLII